jgi:hypothetical protein
MQAILLRNVPILIFLGAYIWNQQFLQYVQDDSHLHDNLQAPLHHYRCLQILKIIQTQNYHCYHHQKMNFYLCTTMMNFYSNFLFLIPITNLYLDQQDLLSYFYFLKEFFQSILFYFYFSFLHLSFFYFY